MSEHFIQNEVLINPLIRASGNRRVNLNRLCSLVQGFCCSVSVLCLRVQLMSVYWLASYTGSFTSGCHNKGSASLNCNDTLDLFVSLSINEGTLLFSCHRPFPAFDVKQSGVTLLCISKSFFGSAEAAHAI